MYLSAIANLQFNLLNVIAIFKNNYFRVHSGPADGVCQKALTNGRRIGPKRSADLCCVIYRTGMRNKKSVSRYPSSTTVINCICSPDTPISNCFLHVDRNNYFITDSNTQ